MQSHTQDGLIHGMNPEQQRAAEALADLCNRHDGTDLPELSGHEAAQLLWFEHRMLCGVAGVGDEDEPETWIMVHPEHRRQGIGGRLLEAARQICARRGARRLLLVCDEATASGPSFAVAAGAHHVFSEHRMELDRDSIDRTRPRHPDLVIAPAGSADLDTITEITAAAFGDPIADVRRRVQEGLTDSTQRYYLARWGNTPIGTLRTTYADAVYITAFAILPGHQGRGYGRQLLLDTVDHLLDTQHAPIRIEVETQNRNALGLYRSCGFREKTTYRYYGLDL